MLEEEVPVLLRTSLWWERIAALASVLLVALLTWVIARRVARRMHGKTRFGLHGTERLVAPVTMLVALTAGLLILGSSDRDPRVIGEILELLAIIAGYWLAARVLDVVWATGHKSARLRNQSPAGTALLAGRHLGKLTLALIAATTLAVRFGASEYIYLVLAGLAATVAFAARDPIRNAMSFAAMVIDPPFRVGDLVRLSDYRSGKATVGEVVDISLTSTTLRTKAHTLVVIANVMVGQLRAENLSAADHRRLELELPTSDLSTEELRAACAAIEGDLRDHPDVAPEPAPYVWISGMSEGLRLKASLWLRDRADRRSAQRDLLLAIRARLEPGARQEATA